MALAAADPGLPPDVAQAGRMSLLELALPVTRCPCIEPSQLGRPQHPSTRWHVDCTPTARSPLQALAVDYARSHLRSELAWTKAKLVVLAHMASGLRTKLAQAQAERAQAGGRQACVAVRHGPSQYAALCNRGHGCV